MSGTHSYETTVLTEKYDFESGFFSLQVPAFGAIDGGGRALRRAGEFLKSWYIIQIKFQTLPVVYGQELLSKESDQEDVYTSSLIGICNFGPVSGHFHCGSTM